MQDIAEQLGAQGVAIYLPGPDREELTPESIRIALKKGFLDDGKAVVLRRRMSPEEEQRREDTEIPDTGGVVASRATTSSGGSRVTTSAGGSGVTTSSAGGSCSGGNISSGGDVTRFVIHTPRVDSSLANEVTTAPGASGAAARRSRDASSPSPTCVEERIERLRREIDDFSRDKQLDCRAQRKLLSMHPADAKKVMRTPFPKDCRSTVGFVISVIRKVEAGSGRPQGARWDGRSWDEPPEATSNGSSHTGCSDGNRLAPRCDVSGDEGGSEGRVAGLQASAAPGGARATPPAAGAAPDDCGGPVADRAGGVTGSRFAPLCVESDDEEVDGVVEPCPPATACLDGVVVAPSASGATPDGCRASDVARAPPEPGFGEVGPQVRAERIQLLLRVLGGLSADGRVRGDDLRRLFTKMGCAPPAKYFSDFDKEDPGPLDPRLELDRLTFHELMVQEHCGIVLGDEDLEGIASQLLS